METENIDISFESSPSKLLPNTTNDTSSSTSAAPSDTLIYEANNLMFSSLCERNFGMTLEWKPWSARLVKIYASGKLTHAKPSTPNTVTKGHTYMLKNVSVQMTENRSAEGTLISDESGLIVKCQTTQGIETHFRLVAKSNDIQVFLRALQTVHSEEIKISKSLISAKHATSTTTIGRVFGFGKSEIRRAIGREMDVMDRRSTKERILAKRGALKWLPVLTANDLTHGSWWFVIGSVGVVITASVVVANKYSIIFSDDDSTLSQSDFVASWVLIAVSGVFSMLGSIAFVRAFHEDPPMAPLLSKYYHFQSDELLGSWLFFLATAPSIPYCLIYLSESSYRSLIYLIGLGFSIAITLGCLLFVKACYPSENRQYYNILLPLSDYLCCCCCTAEWRRRHFLNDWLGATWFFLWACELGTVVTAIIFIVVLIEQNPLLIFVFGTSLLETIAFLIGCAYFVAGSYPEGFEDLVASYRKKTPAELAQEADDVEARGNPLLM